MANFKINDGRTPGSFNPDTKPGYDYRDTKTAALAVDTSSILTKSYPTNSPSAISDGVFKSKAEDHSLIKTYPKGNDHSMNQH